MDFGQLSTAAARPHVMQPQRSEDIFNIALTLKLEARGSNTFVEQQIRFLFQGDLDFNTMSHQAEIVFRIDFVPFFKSFLRSIFETL